MRISRWVLVLGGVGFLCGYFGPILLSRANQGPLFGIFFSGPGGAILGAVLGTCFSLAQVSARNNARALTIAAVVLGAATLYFSVPSPRKFADLVEGEVLSCRDPRVLAAEAIHRIEATDEKRGYRPRKPWDARFHERLRDQPGVVIDFRAHRMKQVFAGRASWDYDELSAGNWATFNSAVRYFVQGFDCSRALSGMKLTLTVRGAVGVWPPRDVAEILGVRTAGAVTEKYARFVERQ